ncbi:MAG: hypothetical protein KC657_31730 [Myxococcales bacterium]|nr:hypothetical protein [Myxococcales bacterium]
MPPNNTATAFVQRADVPTSVSDQYKSARGHAEMTAQHETHRLDDAGMPRVERATAGTVLHLPVGEHDIEAVLANPRAGRALAARVSDEQRTRLLQEHRQLAQKKFREGGVTLREERRLQYVRWALDRIEDAESGEQLDRLRLVAQLQERLAADIVAFKSQVRSVARRTRR